MAEVIRDNLYAYPDVPVVTKGVNIGYPQTLLKNSLIGLQKVSTVVAAEHVTTGDPTMTVTLVSGGPIVGVYKATCVYVDDDITVTNALFIDGMSFTIPLVATYIVGDYWDITVTAGDGFGYLLDKTAFDGTGAFYGILLDDITTVDAEQKACVALSGHFLSQQLIVADGTDVDDLFDEMRALNCYVEKSYYNQGLGGMGWLFLIIDHKTCLGGCRRNPL